VFDEDWIRANLQAGGGSEVKSIAVLPFLDMSVENSEYLSDGLTDELIRALGQVPGLRVASRESTFQFKGRTGDAPRIGAKLGVSIVVEGSVRKLRRRVRVAAELVSVLDGHRIWSGSYKHSVQDLHDILQEIARAVVDRLRAESPGPVPTAAPVLRPRTHSLEAYNLYLKGCYYWNKRTEPAIRRSRGFFEAALDIDPQYAAAYAGLADAYILLGIYSCLPPSEAYPKAREAAIRALDLDDDLAQAHGALGCTSAVYDWDWVRAERSFRRAIELNPSYATAHQWYAINCLSPLGRHEEALAELRLAQEVDPLSISIPAAVGLALHLAGRHEEAVEQCRLTVEMDETFWLTHLFLGWAYQQQSVFREAVAAFQTAIDLSQGDPAALAALGHAYAVQGQTAEATQLLEKLLALMTTRYVPASEVAIVYLGLGDKAKAEQWIDRAHRERSLRLIYFAVDPRLAALRPENGIPTVPQ
jgi:TolB-like protein/Flp pilus assembly protein TadD